MADYLLEHCATDPATREAYLSYRRRSGVTAGNITVFGGSRPGTAWETLVDNLGRAGRMIDALYDAGGRHPHRCARDQRTCPRPARRRAARDGRALKRGKPAGWGTLDTVIDHVQHIIDLVGEDHVGIGTEWGKPYYTAIEWAPAMTNEAASGFDWIGWRPQDNFAPNVQAVDMETWDKWHNLTAAMLERGIPESTVAKVVGGNFLRVFSAVCG